MNSGKYSEVKQCLQSRVFFKVSVALTHFWFCLETKSESEQQRPAASLPTHAAAIDGVILFDEYSAFYRCCSATLLLVRTILVRGQPTALVTRRPQSIFIKINFTVLQQPKTLYSQRSIAGHAIPLWHGFAALTLIQTFWHVLTCSGFSFVIAILFSSNSRERVSACQYQRAGVAEPRRSVLPAV